MHRFVAVFYQPVCCSIYDKPEHAGSNHDLAFGTICRKRPSKKQSAQRLQVLQPVTGGMGIPYSQGPSSRLPGIVLGAIGSGTGMLLQGADVQLSGLLSPVSSWQIIYSVTSVS